MSAPLGVAAVPPHQLGTRIALTVVLAQWLDELPDLLGSFEDVVAHLHHVVIVAQPAISCS